MYNYVITHVKILILLFNNYIVVVDFLIILHADAFDLISTAVKLMEAF